MKKVLLLHGPNLNLLGVREPGVYGTQTLADLEAMVVAYGRENGVDITCFQSNHEGVLVDTLHDARLNYDGVIFNPGALTHYSYSLRDAISSISTPVVEVHISDIKNREPFRAVSVTAEVCVGQVFGKGLAGYREALDVLLSL